MSKFFRFMATLCLLICIFYGGSLAAYYFGIHDSSYDYIYAFTLGYCYAVGEFLLNRTLSRKLR